VDSVQFVEFHLLRFCPVFAIYLAIVLPLIWFLEVSQMNTYLDSNLKTTVPTTFVSTTTPNLPTTQTWVPVVTIENDTGTLNTSLAAIDLSTTEIVTSSTDLLTTTPVNIKT